MGAAIWSTPVDDMLAFPAMSFARFFKNHGLLSLSDRPRWRTVTGGSQVYVAKLAAASGARIATGVDVRQVRRDGASCTLTHGDGRSERFDHVVFACPADHALAMMADAGDGERAALGAFRFQPNRAHLHGDPALMPRRRRAWSSWNYIGTGPADRRRAVAVTYWMNRLQNLDPALPLFVTLNPPTPPRADLTHRVIDYRHPVFDSAAWAAQPKVEALQGAGGLWFAGAWLGYGFHEDGLRAGLRVALALGARLPWAHALTPAGGGSVARAA
jgi:predicted NAD/FAD-binding protein